jgi:hypothetical protein
MDSNFKPSPLKFKAVFDKHGIPLSHIAAHLKLNYPHLANVVNGIARPSSRIAAKLEEVVRELEAQESQS